MRIYIPKDWRCDKNLWLEMRYFCRQYDKFRAERNDILLEYRAAEGYTSTEESAIRLMNLDRKIELIEGTARETVPKNKELRKALMTAVTTDISIIHINTQVSLSTLKRVKRQFYYLLSKKI